MSDCSSIGPTYSELGELVLEKLRKIDERIGKRCLEYSEDFLLGVQTTEEVVKELAFNLERLREQLEEEQKELIQKMEAEDND
ncbi:hypothetical protein HS7_20770 [Sulfolobales archaeon HS-7]|nr:hypothetical protein HS7_20770 [Sulfolobales archaeon HS-7]